MKTHVYNMVLSAVAEVTEITSAEITSHNRQAEVVEARSLLVYYLYKEGLSSIQIAKLSGFTRQCIEGQMRRFPDKNSRSKWLSSIMAEIERVLSQ